MKKSLLIIIHILSVLLFSAGLSVLYTGSSIGNGIAWISEESFEETPQFSQFVDEDISNIKKYAVLKDAFEDNGDLAYERVIVRADTSNGITSYTLKNLIKTAQNFGCVLDEDTHKISIVPNTAVSSSSNYELKIVEKRYDPYYYENLPAGPGQGIMSLKELSFEVMSNLADYYELKGKYESENTNMYFTTHYMRDDGGYADLSNTEKSYDEFRKFGKYLIVEGSERNIDTNINPAPKNAFSSLSARDLFSEDEYIFALGIDTHFPYNDRYRKQAEEFEGNVGLAYFGIFMLIAGGIAAIITLVLFLAYDPKKEEYGKTIELPFTKISYELFVIFILVAASLVYMLCKNTVFSAVKILSPGKYWVYWDQLMKMLIYYFSAVYILFITIRRYAKGFTADSTLIGKIIALIEEFFENSSLTASLCIKFIVFVAFNSGCAAAMVWLYEHRVENALNLMIFAAIFGVLVISDSLIFVRQFRRTKQRDLLKAAISRISTGDIEYEVNETEFSGHELEIAKSINHISVGMRAALNEQVKSERLKADLITNVSHDIKTPLTSIINYVDLIKREDIDNEKVRNYIDILDRKSSRLKNLTEDLLEASKASSGNVKLDMQKIDLVELAMQSGAEFEDKFAIRNLELCINTPDYPVYIYADGRHLWRVLENLYNNAAKYSMENTRVYADVYTNDEGQNIFTIKNISQNKLNISPEELTERFVRGDVSRSTEGSGLGLSIAKSLTKLMGGMLDIEIDGDLYKANIIFSKYENGLNIERKKEHSI
ncbi:MAG: HAMP domain-containing sensor histidine kinase [Eubacteriales bacterium]|nr:HAMP domain-containing sensor histidine kinase [Eubacteriales bacterium]